MVRCDDHERAELLSNTNWISGRSDGKSSGNSIINLPSAHS